MRPSLFFGKTTISLNDYWLGCDHSSHGCQDFIIEVIAHELGHALGLDHSTVNWALMWPDSSQCQQYRIFVPVLDDAKGLAYLYGQNHDTNFASSSASSGSVSGATPPLTLQVMTPASSSYAKVYSSTSLPSSQLAVMIGQVTPQTLYRFDIAWKQGSAGPYASEELDNDAAKLVYLSGTTPRVLTLLTQRNQTTSQTSPSPTVPFWLELVVEAINSNQNNIGLTAYVIVGSISPQNNSDGCCFDASIDTTVDNTGNGAGNFPPPNSWTSATSFEAGVWTDSSSNPASNYQLTDFWIFQGDLCNKLC